MSYADERVAIEGRFSANFTATPIKYDNAPFNQPTNSAWVALTILNGVGNQADIGASNPLHRYNGVIQIDVFVPEDTGRHVALGHADTITGIFRRAQFSYSSSGTITCRAPYVTNLGTTDGWNRSVVSVPFYRDIHQS